ncbi:hypothetical protein LJC68_00250 [Bacteroidales bacterium OttesenSCG-928-B11]|nr:hypothetical protein [Bacteroidales bacterium OttesenSCG-928-C03]MDL2311295.1 hypothetical protein [Bacteroidales bacterium OttesenSCG-928-B11]MDL2326405.1 hypothetical protein [Bacteroidales bacterium OttesenSCG-928-A14]
MYKVRQNLKKVIAIAICLASHAIIFAQDVIILKNGDDIQALVQEIENENVKYKTFDNPNGPIYTLKKISNTPISYQINFGFTQTGIGLCMRF